MAVFNRTLEIGDIVAYASQNSGLRFAIVLNLADNNKVRILPNDKIDEEMPNRTSVLISQNNTLKLDPGQISSKLLNRLCEALKQSQYQSGPKYSPELKKKRKAWAKKFKVPKHGIVFRPLIKIAKVGNPAYDLLSPQKLLKDACYVGNNMVESISESSFTILGIYDNKICRMYDSEGELIDYDWYTLSKAKKVYEKALTNKQERYLEQYDIKELRKQASNATYLDDISSYYNVKPSEMKEILDTFDISNKNRLDLS